LAPFRASWHRPADLERVAFVGQVSELVVVVGLPETCSGWVDRVDVVGSADLLAAEAVAQDQACDAADDINLDTTCPPRVPGATKICLRGA
jgi:hypothetical protein